MPPVGPLFSPSLPSFHSGASLKRLMELNGRSWFSILVNLCICYVSMTWLWSKPMKNHSSGNKESSKEMKPLTNYRERLGWYFWIWAGLSTTDRAASLPRHPQGKRFWGGLGQNHRSTITRDRTEPRPEQSGLLKYLLILGLATKDGEMAAPGSLCTSYHRDGNPSPQISQERACRPPLPLPRIWQGQAHVPTWYLLFFLPSARKHKHHEPPSFLNSPEWLYRVVSERGLPAHTHCPQALMQPVYC